VGLRFLRYITVIIASPYIDRGIYTSYSIDFIRSNRVRKYLSATLFQFRLYGAIGSY